jgi:hypothetical protein
MRSRKYAQWLSLALLVVAAGSALAQTTTPYDVEIGFRTLKVDGNEDMYRTQINERSGLLLRSFTLSTADFEGKTSLFDRFRVDASDLGAGPAGSLRIAAEKSEVYRFNLGYRHTNNFSALPGFANPLLSQGIIPGQHTYDRTQNMLDADLELLPGKAISPFVGYSLNNLSGPGTTTYHQGSNEFLLGQDVKDRDHEFRLGTGFNVGPVYGSVTQGWRTLHSNETFSLAGPTTGNFPDPVLGRVPTATTITRTDRTEVKTPFTNLYATGQFLNRVRITGNYVRFAAESNGDEAEGLTGSFISFGLSRFFNGLAETATQAARNTTWRAGARAEVTILSGLDAFAGYQKDHRELTGTALINTLFQGTTTFTGVDPRDVQTVLSAASGISRVENVTNVGISARPVGPFSLRAEYRQTKQTAEVAPDLSEIVVPGNPDPAGPPQGGTYDRKIKTFDVNGSFTKAGFTLGATYRRDSADNPIFRTDFTSRDRTRMRASYTAPKWVKLGVVAENLKQSNPQTGITFDGKVRQYSADAEVTPVKFLALRGSVSQFKADSAILFRHPENFNTDLSVYTETGKAREGGVLITFAPVSFDAGLSRFTNRGDNPFNIDRVRLRVGVDLPAKTRTALVAEYAKDKYHELTPTFGDFDATRYGIFLRFHP